MTESTAASTDGSESISEKTRLGIRTLKRYLGEEKGVLTIERTHERLQNENIDLATEELDTLIESSAVTTSTTPEGEQQITAIDVYDSTKPRQQLDPFAKQVDGMEGEYGGINLTFEAVSGNSPSAETMPETTADVTSDVLTDLSEVGNAQADALRDAGFGSYTAIQSASVEQLAGIDGVQEKAAEKIRQSADSQCDPFAQVAAAAFSRGDSEEDKSSISQVQLAKKVDIPAGEPIADSEAEIRQNEDLHFYGLPILEPIDHPFTRLGNS